MSLVQATTTRLPLVRHNQTTGANKYGNNPLRPQDLSSQYISSNAASNILLGDYGDRQTSHTYVSFPEIINVQAVEIYASATAEMSWSKASFIRENDNNKLGESEIQHPEGSIYYSIDGLDVSDGSKVWTPLVEFSVIDVGSGVGGQGAGFDIDKDKKDKPTGDWVYTVGAGSEDSADFGYKRVSIPETYGRVNVPVKDSNLKNLILRFSGTSERVKVRYFTPEGREFLAEASSVCFLNPVDYYVYVIQDGPSAYDRAPLIPNITTQPTSSGFISLALNETASITDASVVVSSTGTITYQWYKNGSSISGATTNDYTITSAQLSDAGTYYCEVINTVSGKSLKLNTQPIVVTVGTGLARPAIFTSSADAFWIDKNKLADSDPSTYAAIGVPPIPISYTQISGSNYTSSYDEDYNVYAAFKYRPLSSGKLTVKYQKIGTTNSPNTIASALAQYSTDYTAGTPSWTTFATALGTGGTTDVLVYELTSLPASADDLAIRFGKQNLKGYNGNPTSVSGDISTYSTGNGDFSWTDPANAINSIGTYANGTATAQTITFEEIYSCSTVAKAGALTISGTATYNLLSDVVSAVTIRDLVQSAIGPALLQISYSFDAGSTWLSFFNVSPIVEYSINQAPTPASASGTDVSFSFTYNNSSQNYSEVDLTKVKIKLALTLGFGSLTSENDLGEAIYLQAGGSGNVTIKNLGLSYTPPTIELSTAEFRVNEVYLEYDVDQALTDTVSLSSNKTSVSSGGAVVLTPRFSTGSGSINNGVGTVTSGTTYTVNPTVTTTYTLTVGSVTKSVTITVVAAPAATSLTAGSSTISNGSSTTLTPVFSNGTGKIGTTSGGSDITASATSGTAVTVTPTATTTYYLTVTNSLGATASTSTTVEVAATPVASLARGAAIVTNGLTTTVTPTFANGTAVIGTSGQDSSNIANLATSGTPVTVTPASSATTTYTLTVTATATGQKTTDTTTIQAIAAPTITSFTVNGGASANVTVGNTVTLLGNFTGSGTVNNSVGSITTNTNKVITISSTGAATYTLTASNTATTPATVTSNVTITGYAAPIATSLVAAASSITNGNSTTLTPTFSNGTGKIGTTAGGNQVTASATSGSPITISPTSTTTYYLTVTNVPGTTASTSTTITVVAAPEALDLVLASSTITIGSSTTITPYFTGGYCRIGTTPLGNQITGNSTPVSGVPITITPSATTTYYMRVTNSLDIDSVSISKTLTVVAAPVATALTSGTATITNGTSTTLVPVFSNGTGSINGVGTVTSGTTYTVTPSTTTTYTLTVTNAANSTTTISTIIMVVAAPTATSLTSGSASITAGSATTLVPVFSNGTGSINGVGTVTSGTTYTVTPSTTTTYTLTVTNAAGTIDSKSTTVTVVPAPSGLSFTASTTTITVGNSTTITPTFSNGTAVIGTSPGGSNVTASAVSGTGISVTPGSTTTYYLTVTNSLGSSSSTSITITVVAAPVATSLTPGSSTITIGDSTTLTPVFSNGTGSINNSIGAVTSGTAKTVSPTTTTTYTLTVTNAAGTTATTTATITVVAAPVATSLTAGGSLTVGGSTTLTPVFTNGTGSIDNGVGAVTSGVAKTISPATTTTYTLTVTNAAGRTASKNTTVTVIAAPVATALNASSTIITIGNPITLTPVFSNRDSVLGNGTSTISDGTNIIAGPPYGNLTSGDVAVETYPTSTTTYTLTVINALGASATTSRTVTVVPAPEASLTVGSNYVLRGDSTTLTPVFSNGTGSISGIGPVTSGNTYTIGPLTTSTSYTLTVTNPAGTVITASQYIGIYVRPNSFTASTTSFGSIANLPSIIDGSPGDETTYSNYFTSTDGISTGYIEFAPLSVSGAVAIKYKKVGSYDSRVGGTEGAYLKYTTNGSTYTQIAAVSAGDPASSILQHIFYFTGDLANLKFSVNWAQASAEVPGDCRNYGDPSPEPPFDRPCIEYDPPTTASSTAGFFIYDVVFQIY